jgi:hypothetical protein
MTQQFFLVAASNTNLAIQAGAAAGDGVTLQTLDSSNSLQLWTIALQIGGGYAGVAFLNPQTQNSVTYNGDFAQLVMQTYSPNSADRDSWSLTATSDAFRVALPANNSFSWNDKGGLLQPGDLIALWDDPSANSLWTFVLA